MPLLSSTKFNKNFLFIFLVPYLIPTLFVKILFSRIFFFIRANNKFSCRYNFSLESFDIYFSFSSYEFVNKQWLNVLEWRTTFRRTKPHQFLVNREIRHKLTFNTCKHGRNCTSIKANHKLFENDNIIETSGWNQFFCIHRINL